jgi:hypothetical protein
MRYIATRLSAAKRDGQGTVNWDLALFFGLGLLFAAAHLARRGKAVRGAIVSFVDDPVSGMFLPASAVNVRLNDGRQVVARLDSCTACLGRLSEGDEVLVSACNDGWVIDLEWFRRSCRGYGS